ncbi:MAG: methyl-accepting chemotaxis protein [Burkholderiaceae bacterium]|nr:methyl-accepting chemotaxis protein [Burkholderiaceae bacterium]
MKLRMKLMVAPIVTAALLMASIGVTVWMLESFRVTSQASQEAVLSTYGRVTAVQERLGVMHTDLYRTITIIGSMDDKAVNTQREGQAQALSKMAADATAQAGAAADAKLQKTLTAFATLLGTYQKAADSAIDMATVDANTGVAALQTADGHYKAMSKQLGDVVAQVRASAADEGVALAASAHQRETLVSVLGLLATALSLAFAWTIQRRIARDLLAASRAATEVANGRLDHSPHSDSTDELGDLMRALGTMVKRLRESLQNVQQAADSIGTASAEIATGNLDLSSRTEQTAANLQETSASMEQLTGTVRQSAESSRQANQLAATAADVAARGGAVVSEVVDTMQEINESSRKISDIIAVIDGIAFQTTILALNAAVEAARAGEQGRGFAVVASEVRNLAQRSAQAAKEIKTLIGSSVEKVECGTRLVADAGSTMNEIVTSVKRVSDMIGEITAAAAEQSQGIGQIHSAVTQLDGMTQQNAALVEQSAAAAQSLSTQAQRLRDVVNVFELGAQSGGFQPHERPAAPMARPTPVSRPAAAAPAAKSPAARAAASKPSVATSARAPAASGDDAGWETF